MNKIATYLNQHLLGEASSAKAVRRRYSVDGSILTLTPEIVVFPRVTNDVRKVARFTWQLAEKGHVVGVTARGAATDTTGGAIGKGIVVAIAQHLNTIVAIAPKDRLVHLQAGVSLGAIDQALRWQGLTIQGVPAGSDRQTVGGVLSSHRLGASSSLAASIDKLEVVLANGDVLETGRINKHEVNKKLGLQTFEGEIYRKLSGLLEDNEELITRLSGDETLDTTGYKAVSRVKQRDGSYDLTPLFIGSQGTLGIITEAVLRTDFFSDTTSYALLMLDSVEFARDIADRIVELEPSQLTLIDGALLNQAIEQGKHFTLLGDQEVSGTALVVAFNDIGDRARQHKLKKLAKLTSKLSVTMLDSTDHNDEDFLQLIDAPNVLARMADDDGVSLPILDGAYVPQDRREEFNALVSEMATKHHVELVSLTNCLTGVVTYYLHLKLHSVSDKQKLFRLVSEYAAIVVRCNGAVTSDGAEGRLKAPAAWATLDEDEKTLYEAVRAIFDPFGTLNPGVKQPIELRSLVAALRTSYDTTDFLA